MDFLKKKLQKHIPSNQQPQFSPPASSQPPPQSGLTTLQPPTPTDILRYRYHHGTNLGSIFALEKWLCPSDLFPNATGESELAAATALLAAHGPQGAADRLSTHWHTWVSDADLDWLRDTARCTSVRLPIGFWTLGPDWCRGTAFESVGTIYAGAWQAVVELVERCAQRGIGVLVDLHGLPGGANGQAHSGTDSGKAEFWGSKGLRGLGTRVVGEIVGRLRGVDGVVGVQIVNEADHGSKGMYDWYDEVVDAVGGIDPTMPIYISDGWELRQAVEWSARKNRLGTGWKVPVVIDTHLYWCFSDADQQKTPQQITGEVNGKLGELDGVDGNVVDHGAVQVVVGEYSCVLGEPSWAKSGGTSKDELVRAFGNAECQRYQNRAGGSFFWTYRMEWMPGGEWGFKQMTEQGAIIPPAPSKLSVKDIQDGSTNARAGRDERRQAAVQGHVNYWDSNHPGTYEHQRFEQGWDLGFDDALAFYEMRSKMKQVGADKIGMLDLWVAKRIQESGQGGKFVWEFEHGLRQGIKDFYTLVGL